ncbi:MAG: cyclase family protein [Chthoniobacterales bacterium]
MRTIFRFVVLCGSALCLLRSAHAGTPSLWPLQQQLVTNRMIDLTHAFAPGMPHWPGFPDVKIRTIYDFEKKPGLMGTGFFAQVYTHVGQWGTHVDPPAHFAKGGRTVDQIALREMILPLVVFDVHEAVAKNPDYTLTVERIKQWEVDHGRIPQGAFVALRTDWSKRWPNAAAMENKDAKGVAHYPGWSLPALRVLYEERGATANGHETTDTDPGLATTKDDYTLETYVLTHDHYQIELLTHLDQVPEAGAIVFATFPKPKGGSGFPARVFAVAPK